MKQAIFSLDSSDIVIQNQNVTSQIKPTTKNVIQQASFLFQTPEITSNTSKSNTTIINKDKPIKKTENVYYFS